MSRATSRRIHTARHSPLVLADNFLRGVGRHILTARRYVPVISDDLMIPAAASFARQPPCAGPSADLLAAALVTPLPRTRSPSLVVAAGFAHQLPHAGSPANLLEAALPPPPPSTWLHSGGGSSGAPPPHSGGCSPGTQQPCCSHRNRSSPGLPCRPAAAAPLPYICFYHERFGTAACHCRPPCSWLALQGCSRLNSRAVISSSCLMYSRPSGA